MFIPVKADFKLARFPFLTALVCVICLGVFLKQISDWEAYETAVLDFCDAPRSNLKRMIYLDIAGEDNPMPCVVSKYYDLFSSLSLAATASVRTKSTGSDLTGSDSI